MYHDPHNFDNNPIELWTEHAISRASYFVAKEVEAAAIITPTWSGTTACLVARFRPRQIILAPTPNESALDFLSLCWGVVPLQIPPSDTIDDMIRFVIEVGRKAGYLEAGQRVIVTGGVPLNVAGKTNYIKVDRVPN